MHISDGTQWSVERRYEVRRGRKQGQSGRNWREGEIGWHDQNTLYAWIKFSKNE